MGLAVVKGSNYGKSGLAKLSQKKSGEWEVLFTEDNSRYTVMPQDVPDDIREAECDVSMDENNIKIMSIRPAAKAYYGYFHGFWSKDGNLPTYELVRYQPRTPKRDWDIPEHLKMTALFRIVDDKVWSDFLVRKPLVYCFVNYMDSGVAALKGYGSKKMESFLVELGFDMMRDTIPYTDNVLPALQDLLLEKNKKLILTVGKGGWLNQIVEAP